MQLNEGADATFYSSWYKLDRRVGPALSALDGEHLMCSTQPGWDSLSEAEDVVQAMTEEQGLIYPDQLPPERELFSQQLLLSAQLHSEPYLPLPQPSTPSENQPQHWRPPCESQSQTMSNDLQGSAFTPVPEVPLTQQRAGEAGIPEVENDEEEDMQGWVCLPGTVDKSLGLVENSLDFGEGSLDVFSGINDTTLSVQPETSSDKCKLSGGRAEDTGEKEQLEEGFLGLNCAPLLDERSSGEGHLEAEMMEKEGIWSEERRDSENTSIQGDRGSDVEAASSEIAEKKQKDGEDNEQPQDGKMETSVAESEEKITSCVSVQVSVISVLTSLIVILSSSARLSHSSSTC